MAITQNLVLALGVLLCSAAKAEENEGEEVLVTWPLSQENLCIQLPAEWVVVPSGHGYYDVRRGTGLGVADEGHLWISHVQRLKETYPIGVLDEFADSTGLWQGGCCPSQLNWGEPGDAKHYLSVSCLVHGLVEQPDFEHFVVDLGQNQWLFGVVESLNRCGREEFPTWMYHVPGSIRRCNQATPGPAQRPN
ncbi:MAG: hypothetical protein WC538_24395 [Thermoanaerobaculia bacterium]